MEVINKSGATTIHLSRKETIGFFELLAQYQDQLYEPSHESDFGGDMFLEEINKYVGKKIDRFANTVTFGYDK
jgi:hypothetical protein